MQNEKDGDMGYDWLKSRSAGSGAFSLKTWKANEIVTLEANSGYRHGTPGMKRVILRHVSEPSSQRLLLEKGDIDMAIDTGWLMGDPIDLRSVWYRIYCQ